MSAVCVVDSACALGEGPCWDPRGNRLWWVDILKARVHWFEPGSGETGWFEPGLEITALGLRRAGGLVAATPRGAGVLDPATGRFELRFAVPDEPESNRSNDGGVCADGAFWFGTMDRRAEGRSGAIYRVRPDWSGERVLSAWGIPNTLRTDCGGRRLYVADSADQRLFTCDLAEGSVRPVPFASTTGSPATPDGSAIDAEDHLWNAQWDGARVVRYAPDGRVDRVIDLPVQRPTSCAFGGEDLSTLFITSARDGLGPPDLRRQPLAGGLFAFRSGVVGAAPLFFEG